MVHDRPAERTSTRERAMDIAEADLAGSGYRALSLQTVADRIGVSKPALYYHFPGGKQELVVAVLHRSLRRLRAGLRAAIEAAGPEGGEQLRAAASWLLDDLEQGHGPTEMHDAVRFLHTQHHDELARAFHAAAHEPLHAVFTEAIAARQFRSIDPDAAVSTFLAMVSGAREASRLPRSALGPQAGTTADQMVQLLLEGVRAP